MKVSKTLTNWLVAKKITLNQLLSIAFVPKRTAADVFKGKRYLPPLSRLFMVTGLNEFALSNKEQQKYQQMKKERKEVQADHLICEHLYSIFSKSGMVPVGENALATNSRIYPDKKELTKKLLEEISRYQVSGDEPGSKNIKELGKEIYELLKRKKHDDIVKYLQTNKTDLKALQMGISILLDPDPLGALNQVQDLNSIFQQKKS